MRTAALALVPLLALAGCGSSPALTQQAYVARAEKVCARLAADGRALPDPTSPAGLPAYLRAGTALTVKARGELLRLTSHYRDRSYVERIFLGPMGRQVDAVQAVLPALERSTRRGDTSALDRLALPQADLPAMRRYGFDACYDVVSSA